MAKKGQVFKKYSQEFKISILLDMRSNKFSYHATVRKYGLGNDKSDGVRHMVQQWERKYLEE